MNLEQFSVMCNEDVMALKVLDKVGRNRSTAGAGVCKGCVNRSEGSVNRCGKGQRRAGFHRVPCGATPSRASAANGRRPWPSFRAPPVPLRLFLCSREEDVDYGDVQYWLWRYRESWYQQPFDWLGNWKTLSPWIQAVAQGRVVHLGCGTSTLAEEMLDAGYTEIWNVDISEDCLKAGESVHTLNVQWFIQVC